MFTSSAKGVVDTSLVDMRAMYHNVIMKPRLLFLTSLSFLALIWLLSARSSNSGSTFGGRIRGVEKATQNRTLGFGEIFMAILPARTDQKDTASLLSHYSDLDITIVDGVTEVSRKAVPGGHGAPGLRDGELGCWRVHMDMLRMVVDKRLETALIMEGDVDWDVRIKDQFTRMSENLPDSTAKNPYGNSWMYLFMANCGHAPNTDKKGPFVVYSDETVGDLYDQPRWVKNEASYYGVTEGDTRIIAQSYKPFCTTAYAVTFQGALRMLYEAGHKNLTAQIDVIYQTATMEGKLPGLSVTPPLMSQWRTGFASDSDIRKPNTGPNFTATSGPAVRQSARKLLENKVYESTPLGWAHGASDVQETT